MKAIIKQPAGIGDIFFCQKIANQIRKLGFDIVWPVIPEFLWLNDYIDNIEFVDHKNHPYISAVESIGDYDGCMISDDGEQAIVNLQGADRIHRNMSVMKAKYAVMGLRWDNWADHFNFKRNTQKENDLFYDVLKLTDGEQFAFKNYHYASPPNQQICTGARDADVSDLREVCMQTIEGFTLFDWCKVLEKASMIHTVETSLNYIIEKLVTTDKLFMYSKWTPSSYYHIEGLFNKPWIYD